ncbi:MAG TPA: efflux RND transporter permease subunit [Ramlibacter sp.]|jgi:HAE1 family hydrophobic/amphiphilic exporter-1/multidrug efflux pump|uniref:efflux RND transporter permease subunit n=1 Tax=Ramlibacter sp. TaxID=1917967 RepID=UPI002D41BF49|nr:efflux RND transporter permease subunit [Ramlibacter sp.]HZY19199.1 efflux RND transporter permease subunit [Ramlibacter sp.]
MARFFIDRPVFAWVLAIATMLAGLVAIKTLPIAQYPAIAPPAVTINATYPGATAKTLEDTVTQIIEQKMKGLDRLRYMQSTSDSSGAVAITLTFENGTDADTAQVQVQNKLALATPLLPQEVQQQGVQVSKSSTNFLAIYAFVSADGRMSGGDLADVVAAQVVDPVSRVEGVGDTTLFGSQRAMRIWLDADKLANYKLAPLDVRQAVQAHNVQVAAGQLGGLPAVPGQALNATITARTKLKTADEFAGIRLRTQADGASVYLRDVARVELGNEQYAVDARYNGKPAAGLAVKLATGANALDTVKAVDAELDRLRQFLPAGMEVVKPYDTAPFVRLSIQEVVKTLAEAIVLVFLVMLLFLQNFRATLIPTIAVPVVLLGTFGVMAAFGYTINTLTMLAMVLAIGLLVDDAIVVVENVERLMQEKHLSAREATYESMGQISGALIGVALVLAAVFLPMAFFGGAAGVIYRQFTVAIVAAMTLSVLVAMILTPALCATLLRPGHALATTGFFGAFNRVFDRGTTRYEGVVRGLAKRSKIAMVAYVVLAGVAVFGLSKVPGGFLPDEDQGVMFTLVQLPAGATQQRTQEVIKQVERHYLEGEKEAVEGIFTVAGFSFAGSGQNTGLAFVKLKPWDQRTGAGGKAAAIAGRANAAFAPLKDGMVFAVTPPAVSELGNATGFDLMLQDRGNLGHEALTAARNQLLAALAKEQGLVGVRPNGLEDTPEFRLVLDENKLGALGLSISDVNGTLGVAWAGSYVNDFLDAGRVKKVFLQADARHRMAPEDLDRWFVRNNAGSMVPFAAFAKGEWTSGSPRLERYNGLPSMQILGMAMPGAMSSGDAMALVERHAAQLPPGIGFEWSGLSLQERESAGQATLLYLASILVVFLCLAALYESWSVPFAVILAVPLGVLGTVAAAVLTWKMNDVYFQVGLLTTVGLASKNAILIVEFAKALVEQGRDVVDAAVEAARMRLRPILMTSLAFVLGVLPLAHASGAGAGAQNALGAAVIGGMVGGTLLVALLVPVFFVAVQRAARRRAVPQQLSTNLEVA